MGADFQNPYFGLNVVIHIMYTVIKCHQSAKTFFGRKCGFPGGELSPSTQHPVRKVIFSSANCNSMRSTQTTYHTYSSIIVFIVGCLGLSTEASHKMLVYCRVTPPKVPTGTLFSLCNEKVPFFETSTSLCKTFFPKNVCVNVLSCWTFLYISQVITVMTQLLKDSPGKAKRLVWVLRDWLSLCLFGTERLETPDESKEFTQGLPNPEQWCMRRVQSVCCFTL